MTEKKRMMKSRRIIKIFQLLNITHVMFLLVIVSKVWVSILMTLNKRVHSKTLLFQSIYKLNSLPINRLMIFQELNIVKKHSIRLFHQVTPKESIVWKKLWCIKKCWRLMWFLTAWKRKISLFSIDWELSKHFLNS